MNTEAQRARNARKRAKLRAKRHGKPAATVNVRFRIRYGFAVCNSPVQGELYRGGNFVANREGSPRSVCQSETPCKDIHIEYDWIDFGRTLASAIVVYDPENPHNPAIREQIGAALRRVSAANAWAFDDRGWLRIDIGLCIGTMPEEVRKWRIALADGEDEVLEEVLAKFVRLNHRTLSQFRSLQTS